MKTYHKNPRQITTKQYSDLERWLRELGDLSGIVHDLNSDEIIGGNQRSRVFDVNACQTEITMQLDAPDEQGTVANGFIIWEGKRYAYRQVRWNAKQCEQANIVANKAGGAWDFDVLANEFEMPELIEWGFSEGELGVGNILPTGDDPGARINRAEELREKWSVELGQLWQLGEHRIICGDSTDRAVVERLMGGEKANALVTDPPYNVGIEYGSGINDSKTIDENEKFISKWFSVWKDVKLKIITPGAGYYLGTLKSWLTLFPPTWMCLWLRKNSMSHSPLRGFAAWEPVLYYDVEPEQSDWGGVLVYGKVTKPVGQDIFDIPVRVQKDVADEDGNKLHPTPKPLELFDELLTRFTKQGDIIAEPFCGSGTTLIACERLGRKCRAIEISPAYVAVALERWSVISGKTPELTEGI